MWIHLIKDDLRNITSEYTESQNVPEYLTHTSQVEISVTLKNMIAIRYNSFPTDNRRREVSAPHGDVYVD
jgi:hypothetical protein